MKTLFPLPDSPSPRLQWLEKHKVKTHHAPHMEEDPWCAFIGTFGDVAKECVRMENDGRMVYAETENDAIIKLAKHQGWRLWNEESL
jgi:hypothetical protein